MTARAIHVLHTAIFDAWAAYDARALGTRLRGSLRQPAAERTLANKNKAISFAAYTAPVDLFPARRFDFAEQMSFLGYAVNGSDTSSAANVGTTAAQAVIDYRHSDGSNQLNGYADTTGYQPVNTGDVVVDPGAGNRSGCRWTAGPSSGPPPPPQWSKVKGFALKSPFQFAVPGPDRLQSGFDPKHIDNLLALSANLSYRQKVTAEYWPTGRSRSSPRPLGPDRPGAVAQARPQPRHRRQAVLRLGQRPDGCQHRRLGGKVPLGLRPADHRDPVALQGQAGHLLAGGPCQGYGTFPGERWIPYQAPNVVSPPFLEYVSGHSTFSAAAAAILAKFTGSDAFGAGVTIEAGTSLFEPRTDTQLGTPAANITLSWPTLTAAAKDAGLSRRLGGIHFQDGDEHGYNLGQRVGTNVLARTTGHRRHHQLNVLAKPDPIGHVDGPELARVYAGSLLLAPSRAEGYPRSAGSRPGRGRHADRSSPAGGDRHV